MKHTLASKLGSLVIFRNLLELPVVKAIAELDSSDRAEPCEVSYAYGKLMNSLLMHTSSLTEYLLDAVLEDENIYTAYKLLGKERDELYEEMLSRELKMIEEVSQYDAADIRALEGMEDMPVWRTEKLDFLALYRERMSEINTKGFGIFAKYHMFIIDGARIIPIKNPDTQTLYDLVGYEKERSRVIENTEAFLTSRPANNVLLYGDAGTGKSSTVKAIANSYADRGLRLIEFKKEQLSLIPHIIEQLANNPLKFIFFIDDLTFTSDDKDFCALKATLEGGVSSRGKNILIYATSNHRHMIKESAAARQDSVNTADIIQETVSLSARFGITVTYLKLDRAGFADTVCKLAEREGITLSDEELVTGAEAFALRGGGRNPRTARQYIDMLLGC